MKNRSKCHHPWLASRRTLTIFFFGIAVQSTANAALAQNSFGAASTATAGSGRAAIDAGEAQFMNPATLVHLRGRDLHTFFSENEWSVGMTENARDSAIPAGLGYIRREDKNDPTGLATQDLILSLAGEIRPGLSFGVSGHQYETSLKQGRWTQINADFGFIWNPLSNLGFAAVLYNPLDANENVPKEFRLRSHFGLAVNWLYRPEVRVRADWLQDSTDPTRQVGMFGYESYLNEFVVVRLGYQVDRGTDQEIAAGGAGLDLPRFRLNYAYQTELRGDEKESRHAVDLGIPF